MTNVDTKWHKDIFARTSQTASFIPAEKRANHALLQKPATNNQVLEVFRVRSQIVLFLLSMTILFGSAATASEISIEPGDVLAIRVQGHEEFTKTVTVNSRGMVNYPFMSNTPVSGMSTGSLQDFLTYKLAGVISRPVVLISIPQTYMIEVSVLGQVNHPGVIQLSTKSSVQEAIMKAGSGTEMDDWMG